MTFLRKLRLMQLNVPWPPLCFEWRVSANAVWSPVDYTAFSKALFVYPLRAGGGSGNETCVACKRLWCVWLEKIGIGMTIRKVLWCRPYLVWLLFGIPSLYYVLSF